MSTKRNTFSGLLPASVGERQSRNQAHLVLAIHKSQTQKPKEPDS